jgi:hypothetical protein
LASDFERAPEEELVKVVQEVTKSRWYHDSTRISLLAFILSLAAAIVPIYIYIANRADDKAKRSVTEIERVYDRDFIVSLSKILDHAYKFIEDNTASKVGSKARFEKFWGEVNVDPDMLLLTSRLKAIAQCADVGDCDGEELFSRFPEAVYQAIFFLREFLFLNDDLTSYAKAGDLEGWWLGNREYKFLANYCAWAYKKNNEMNLWSVKHERLRSPGQPLPDPCLH